MMIMAYPTMYLSKSQKSHKDKLVQMAVKHGGSSVKDWRLAKVTETFRHNDYEFQEGDVIVVSQRDRIVALCTRSITTVELPDIYVYRFKSYEDPFDRPTHLVLPEN